MKKHQVNNLLIRLDADIKEACITATRITEDYDLEIAFRSIHAALKSILYYIAEQSENLQVAADLAETFADANDRYTDQGGCDHYLPQKGA